MQHYRKPNLTNMAFSGYLRTEYEQINVRL